MTLLCGLVRPLRRYAVGVIAASGCIAVLQLATPFLTRRLIDEIIPRKDIVGLWLMLGALTVVLIVRVLGTYFNGIWLAVFRDRAITALQSKLFAHVEQLSIAFHDDCKLGYLLSRVNSDPMRLNSLLSGTLVTLVTGGLSVIAALAACLFLDWKLGMIALATLPPLVFIVHRYSIQSRESARRVQEEAAELSATLGESLGGIQIVKAFGIEKRESERVNNRLQRSYASRLAYVKTTMGAGGLASAVAGVGPLVILIVGGWDVMRGSMTLGTYFAFTTIIGSLYGAVSAVVGASVGVQDAMAALDRIEALLDQEPETDRAKRTIRPSRIDGRVCFDHVSFSYQNMGFRLQEVSFAVSRGQTVALVGRSGAGKSTLIKLLSQFYKPTAGRVTIDDIDVTTISLDSLRSAISMVPQDVFLFTGTVIDNIRIARDSATEADVLGVLDRLGVLSRIDAWPDGIQTRVGRGGARLSGGEKQLIATARALIREAPILVMDEATSQLDSETELLVRQAVKNLCRERTTIVIAHRLSTVVAADKIVLLDSGMVTGLGTHHELAARFPAYQRLCESQLLKDTEPASGPQAAPIQASG